jgi:hypothetical protein
MARSILRRAPAFDRGHAGPPQAAWMAAEHAQNSVMNQKLSIH